MSFDKNGETKVFVTKAGEKVKTASTKDDKRYGVEDLIRDAEKAESDKEEAEEDVSE